MTERPWQPPHYADVHIRAGYTDYVCDRCGVFISDIIAHNRHHHSLDKLKDWLSAVTKILLPDLPVGAMISVVDILKSNVDALPEDTPSGEGGNAGVSKDAIGAAGGGGGSIRAHGKLSIGKGGSGFDPDIPECPICHAVGGGGHGGGCPNGGARPISEWLAKLPEDVR